MCKNEDIYPFFTSKYRANHYKTTTFISLRKKNCEGHTDKIVNLYKLNFEISLSNFLLKFSLFLKVLIS